MGKKPCFNGGTCEKAWDGSSCSCKSGYSGTNCETSKTKAPTRVKRTKAPTGRSKGTSVCIGDFDGDNAVGASDLTYALGKFSDGKNLRAMNKKQRLCEADLNVDGEHDNQDILMILNWWGLKYEGPPKGDKCKSCPY